MSTIELKPCKFCGGYEQVAPQERVSRDRDIILEAINEYDEWMKDDDYDAQPVLDRIIQRMRERAALSTHPHSSNS